MHSGRDAADNGEGRERGVTSILITDGHELAGLGAARSLGRAGHRVTVAVPQGLSAPVARSRYVAQVIDSPSPWADQAAFRRFLLAEARKYEVLLPVSEAAIAATATLRAELHPTRLLMPSDDALRYTLSKYHATKLAQSVGLATPPTVFLSDGSWPDGHSSDDLAPLVESLRSLGYPLLLKHDNYLSLSGKYVRGSTQKVYSPLQARALLAELREQRAQVIAQTEMPGHGAGVFLLRHHGQTVLRFAHERLHEVPYTGGVSSLRMSCHDDPLVARSEKLLAKLDYQGVAMVEFRKDQQGEPLFLEVNGRLWGSLALALHAGVDFPLQLLRCALGEPLPTMTPDYPDGLRCRNVLPGELSHLSSLLRAPSVPLHRKVGAALEQVLLSFYPSIRHDHLWSDDPGPAFLQANLWTQELGQRLLGRVRRSKQMYADRALLVREQQSTEARFLALPRPLRRVLVLCLGNICRSPFAEHYLRRVAQERGLADLVVESAGFLHHDGRRTPTRFVEMVRPHGVDLSQHQAARVQREQIADADLILVMDSQNLGALHAEFPQAASKTFLIGWLAQQPRGEIPDPYLLSLAEAEASYAQLASACAAVVNRLPVR